jgi:spore maturation protein CgeB
MKNCLSIIYVGELEEGTTSFQRLRALEQLGHRVWPVASVIPEKLSPRTLLSRVSHKLFRMGVPHLGPLDLARTNQRILDLVRTRPVDVLWLDKALAIQARTLRRVKAMQPSCSILGYSPDDMNGRHNQTGQFLRSLPWYDFYFTTKTYGVSELLALGCPRAYFVPNAYDPHTHRPMPLTAERKRQIGGPVGFIGTFEAERAQSILFLASQGIDVRVYGDGKWDALRGKYPNLRIEGHAVYGNHYAEAICAFDINLCFLRRLNRDRQTQRSVEIPACGAFMLAERTEEHLDLFKEGVEAEFFSSDQELLDKVRYYLAHPDERMRIAAAGRRRCLESGYSYADRIQSMLEKVTNGPRSEWDQCTNKQVRKDGIEKP